MFSTILKFIGSFLLIMFFTGIIVGSSVLINIFKMADNTVDVDLHTLKLDLTSLFTSTMKTAIRWNISRFTLGKAGLGGLRQHSRSDEKRDYRY